MVQFEIRILLAFTWAFVVCIFAIPSIIKVAHVKNLLDEPNHRTMHASLTPRLGGLAIFAGFISSITIFGVPMPDIQRVIAGTMLLFFIGLKDDVVSISAFKKFFVQILSTGIIIFMGDIRVTSFQGFLGIYQLDAGISYGLTFIVIIGITNAVNLIDGLDGLAGSLVCVMATSLGIYFLAYDQVGYATLAFCLVGAVVGFLRYNIYKAIIFMGDTGSLVCGFLVAVLAIKFVEMQRVNSAPSIAVAIMIIPLFDTIRVFASRLLKGKSPFSPDRNHIHHILCGAGLKPYETVAVLAGLNVLIIVTTSTFAYLGDDVLLGSLLAFLLLLAGGLEYLRRAKLRADALAAMATGPITIVLNERQA